MKSQIFLLFAIVSCISAADKLKNIGYLSYGYDIFMGNPNPFNGLDAGFRNFPFFDFKYDTNTLTSDGVYLIPDRVTATSQLECNLDMTTTTIKSSSSYQKTLNENLDVTLGVLPNVSFTANTEFKSVKRGVNNESKVYTSSISKCSVYNAQINSYYPPEIHPGFIAEVKDLPSVYNSYTKQQYMNFIRRRGTHYFSGMVMGAKVGYFSTLTKSGYNNLQSSGVKVTIEATYSALKKVHAKSVTDSQKEETQAFEKEVKETVQISVGSLPPKDGDQLSWAQQTYTSPMPIKYSLDSISNLFTNHFLPSINDIDSLRANMENALKDYCGYLKLLGIIETCSEDGTSVAGSCRLCAGGCGGDFPLDGGAMSKDQSWPNFFMAYDNKCSGSLSHNNYNRGEGVHLCCTPEDARRVRGYCRLCTSCGVNYQGGSLMTNQQWPNWINAYGEGCFESLRTRYHTGNGIQLCCKNEDMCSLCSTCGGSYPYENGVMSTDRHWPDFFNIKGNTCSGSISHKDYNDGVSLCCKSSGD